MVTNVTVAKCHHEVGYGVKRHQGAVEMTPAELVALALEKQDLKSIRSLAQRIGIDHSNITRWSNGDRMPDFEQALVLAELAGLPPEKTAAEIRLSAPITPQARRILKRIASAAALFFLAVYTSIPKAHAKEAASNINSDGLYIRHVFDQGRRSHRTLRR